MKESKKPAFPISEEETDRIEEGVDIFTGITIRDYFAAKAMQGLLSNIIYFNPNDNHKMIRENLISKRAYSLADTMLRERER